MTRARLFWLSAVAAAAIGGYLLGSSRDVAPSGRTVDRTHAEVPVRSVRDRPVENRPSTDLAALLEERLGRKPTPAEVEHALGRARALRARYEQAMEGALAAAAVGEASRIRKAEAFLEDRQRGGTMEFLRALQKERVHPFPLLEDPVAFARHFERSIAGPVMDGPFLKRNDEIPDGSEIRFPSGAWTWQVSGLPHRQRFPRDLLVQGEGMDRTVVRIDEISTRDEVHSLTFRDLTIDCGDDHFTDMRSRNPVVIRLERCRVVAFDNGAGGSLMLASRTAAFHASDCRIEAGYGQRSGWDGNLFRVRSGLLVRMENCTLAGPFNSVYDRNDSATYLFLRCRFENMHERQRATFERVPEGVRFTDCTFTYLPKDWKRPKSRPVHTLNPQWTPER